MNEFVIVFWSISEWDKMGRRPMIRALAKNLEGIANILYIDTPFSPVTTFLSNRERYNRINKKSSLEKISQNLYRFTPNGLLNEYAIKKLRIQKIYYKALEREINRIIQTLGWNGSQKISWVNYPSQINQVGVVNESLVVYECYDEYRSFSQDKKKNQRMSDLEDKLLKKVDIVFTTSHPLYNSRKELHPNVFLTPNGVNFTLFNKTSDSGKIIEDIDCITHPIIGFIGNITPFINLDIFRLLAEKHPDWSLVLIGPYDKRSNEVKKFMYKIKSRDNIFYLGSKPFEELHLYLNSFDVAINPFKINNFTNAINPLKIWEYMACGKPTVSTAIKPVKKYKDIIYVVDNKLEFTSMVENVLKDEDPKRIKKGIELASCHSWENITSKIVEIIKNKFC